MEPALHNHIINFYKDKRYVLECKSYKELKMLDQVLEFALESIIIDQVCIRSMLMSLKMDNGYHTTTHEPLLAFIITALPSLTSDLMVHNSKSSFSVWFKRTYKLR